MTPFLLIQKRFCGSAEDPVKKLDPAQSDSVVNLSRAEAKQAWLVEGSDVERATRQALRERLAKVRHVVQNIFSLLYLT